MNGPVLATKIDDFEWMKKFDGFLVESDEKPTKFYDVQVRVRDDFNVEMHIDTDDANSAGIKHGDKVVIIKK